MSALESVKTSEPDLDRVSRSAAPSDPIALYRTESGVGSPIPKFGDAEDPSSFESPELSPQQMVPPPAPPEPPCGRDGSDDSKSEPRPDCLEDPSPAIGSRSFQANPDGFLAGIQARADSLFACGYRVRAARMPHLFIVIPPLGRKPLLLGEGIGRACPGGPHAADGYMVNPVLGTCSCPFFAQQEMGRLLTDDGTILPCKHLVGLEKLVADMVQHCKKDGADAAIYRLFRLLSQWMAVLAERYRPPETARARTSRADACPSAESGRVRCSASYETDCGSAASPDESAARKEVSRNGTHS